MGVGIGGWNGVDIQSRSLDISTSSLAAAIFEFRLPVTTCSIRNSAAELMNPENWGLAVGTELLSGLEAEIQVYFRFGGRHL